MKGILFQSSIIAISFFSVYLWKQSDLAVYTVPALGILTSFYLISTMKRHKNILSQSKNSKKNALLIVFLLNTSSLLLIQATGGFHSILFFILYFLLFYISFMLQSETVFLFTTAALFFFLPEIIKGDTIENTAKIASFLLLSPLAYFFGKEITLRENEIKETNLLKDNTYMAAERIINNVSDLVKNEGETLNEEDLARLHEIVEESKLLEEESK